MSLSGVSIGKNIFQVSKKQALNNIKENSYINNVEIKDINISRKIVGESVSEISCPGNISPEGYFYNPYTKIKIKEFQIY